MIALMQLNYLIVFLAIELLSLYVAMSGAELLRLLGIGFLMALVYGSIYPRTSRRLLEPVTAWLEGARRPEETAVAWQACVSFPREMLRRELDPRSLGLWVAFVNLAWCSYATWELGLEAYAMPLLFAGVLVYMAYTLILRFLVTEQLLRPVSDDLARHLPDAASPEAPRLGLRWRLLAALPAINVISGVVAVGVVKDAGTVSDLGVAVLASVAVAVTVSLVLTVLLSDSITGPVGELSQAAEAVGRGDFSVRVPVVTTDETGDLAQSFNEMTAGLAERERIRKALGTYVDEEVAEHILREGTDLAGEEVEVTMMFIDIRDFTGFAERCTAPEVVGTLNRLFERVVPTIHAHGGHVDKFVGDGLLAVFGAPRRQRHHADRALAAALDIEREVGPGSGGALEIGVGLNSGRVVAGNVGAAGRLEFSVFGDAVNVAARVEAATRQTGDVVLISEDTRRSLRSPHDPELEPRPGVELKGKGQPVTLYAPRARTPAASP